MHELWGLWHEGEGTWMTDNRGIIIYFEHEVLAKAQIEGICYDLGWGYEPRQFNLDIDL